MTIPKQHGIVNIPNGEPAMANEKVSQVCEFLEKKFNVTSFQVSFEGSGDSGQIENVSNFKFEGETDDDEEYNDDQPTEQEKTILDSLVDFPVENGYTWNNDEKVPTFQENPTVEDAITSLCYELLESKESGWGNNDGAFGTFTFNVKEKTCHLEFNSRFMDIETNHYNF